MIKRFFYNEETSELYVMTIDAEGESAVEALDECGSIEYEDEVAEREPEPERPVLVVATPKDKKPAGGGRGSGKRLTDEQRQEILRMSAQGRNMVEIAKAIGTTTATVYNVRKKAGADRIKSEDEGVKL